MCQKGYFFDPNHLFVHLTLYFFCKIFFFLFNSFAYFIANKFFYSSTFIFNKLFHFHIWVLTKSCSSKQIPSKNLPRRPSTIFSTIFSGLPSLSACSFNISLSAFTSASGTSSRLT